MTTEHEVPSQLDDDVRRWLADALVQKIREIDGSDWETVSWYLEQIAKLTTPVELHTEVKP